jgi:predicted esterase
MSESPLVITAGRAVNDADAVLVLLHGRGGSAQDMIGLFDEIDIPQLAALAPQAPGHTWYPQSFLAPIESNQPYLDNSLRTVAKVVNDLIARGTSADRIALLGFSQGACLCTEFCARHPRRYGAIIALTGGLIGPPGTRRNYPGSLDATPVFLGSSDPDPHVPFSRVQETRDVFTAMGASVELRRYPGMPHTINEEEILIARQMLQRLIKT